MNATLESYKEPLRQIADEPMEERQGTRSNRKSDKKPLARVQEYLDALVQCAEKLTQLASKFHGLAFKVALLGLFLFEIGLNVPKLLNIGPSEPQKGVAGVIQPPNVLPEPAKSDKVVQPSGPLAEYTAEKSGNSPTSPISKKRSLTSQPPNSKPGRGSNSHVAGSGAVQRQRGVAETRSRQFQLPRLTSLSETRFYNGQWYTRDLQSPAKLSARSPRVAGL